MRSQGRELRVQPFLNDDDARSLEAGERVRITGELLTARDAACKRIIEAIESGQPLPIDLRGRMIYAVGPTPPKPGQLVGSAGPTTASRLLPYLSQLLAAGVKGLIGKGDWPEEGVRKFIEGGGVYFAAIGGLGALIAKRIQAVEVLAYEDLGTEAIRRFTVADFPAIVAIDQHGNNVYAEARRRWRQS